MSALRRVLAVAATITTLTLLTGAVLSTTQAGTGAFKWLASNIPVANVAPAGGGGQATSVLPPVTVSVSSPVTLVDKIQIEADATVTCGPFLSLTNGNLNVQIFEAAGHVVATASGGVPLLTCDGSPHTYAVTMLATTVPFRPGHGVASSNAFVCGTTPDFLTAQCVTGTNTQAVDISK